MITLARAGAFSMISLTREIRTAVSLNTRPPTIAGDQVRFAAIFVAVAAVVEQQQIVRFGGIGYGFERDQDVVARR